MPIADKARYGVIGATPMGWDAFGLPAVTAVISGHFLQQSGHINEYRSNAIAIAQKLGLSVDLEYEVTACSPGLLQSGHSGSSSAFLKSWTRYQKRSGLTQLIVDPIKLCAGK